MMDEQNLSGKKAIEKLKDIVNDVKVAMMCTTRQDYSVHSRPMATAGIDDDGTLWFFTNESSEKVREIESEHGITLCYSQPSDNTYATVMGRATAMDNRSKKKELWSDMLKAWFPKGVDDPDLTLIKVTPHHAEYWDDNDSRMVVFFKIAKAAMTGDKYVGGDAHGKMKL